MNASYGKYPAAQHSISSILGYIDAGDIAIPESQRPFVWNKRQMRCLIDSLYNGYPTGYLIIWQSPDVKLTDGGCAVGKKGLIDGQQHITALITAIAGHSILTENSVRRPLAAGFLLWGDLTITNHIALQQLRHRRSDPASHDAESLSYRTFTLTSGFYYK